MVVARSIDATTSSTVNGDPSEKLTFGWKVNSQRVSSSTRQDAARPGFGCEASSFTMTESKMCVVTALLGALL
jgi:hypothetical protein